MLCPWMLTKQLVRLLVSEGAAVYTGCADATQTAAHRCRWQSSRWGLLFVKPGTLECNVMAGGERARKRREGSVELDRMYDR